MIDPATAAAVIAAERRLLVPEQRMDRASVTELLDPGYTEIGQSGRFWTYEAMVEALAEEEMSAGLEQAVVSEEQVRELAPGLYLLTYLIMVGARRTRRSSIWRDDAGRLRVVYHQGTPVPTD